MIAKQFRLHYRLGKNIQLHNKTLSLLTKPTHSMSSISQYVRKFMNRIKFQDNRAIQPSQDKVTLQILQTPKQVDQKFIGDQQFKSVVEKQRMQKIDQVPFLLMLLQIIGTRTYFHETKKYQQRIDSDHVMVIDDLAKKHPEPRREHLNWENTQAPQQYKVKSTRKFYKNLKNLRQYPKHNYRISQFADEKSQENIQFLGKESLFSKLSLKWVDTFQKSLQNEIIDDKSYELHAYRYSQRFVYFATEYESSKLYRIPREKFTQKLLHSPKNFEENKNQIEQVITMQQIYDLLKDYFHDERVTQWLKKVENGEIGYLLSGYKTNENEDGVVVWVDLLGTKKEYVHLYKRIGGEGKVKEKENIKGKKNNESEQTKQQQKAVQGDITTHTEFSHPPTQFINRLIFNCKPQAAFFHHKNNILLIQRGQQGSYVQLISIPIQPNNSLGRPQIIYKCKLYEQIDLIHDQGMGCLFINVRNVSDGCVGKVFAVEENNGQQGGIELVEIDVRDLGSEEVNDTVNEQATTEQQTKSSQHAKDNQSNHHQQQPTRLSLSTCPSGLIFINYYPSNSYFKHGPNTQYSTRIHLIPFKSHIQLMHESSTKLSQPQLISGRVEKVKSVPSMRELDVNGKKVIFECASQEFITEISVRSSHVIISLSTLSIYNKKRLLFLPHDQSKNPHSLIFAAYSLHLLNTGYNYTSQTLTFSINRSLISNEHYQYTIWKKELKQLMHDQMYLQKVKVDQNIELTVMCLNKYLEHLPRFYVQDGGDQKEQGLQNEEGRSYAIENSKVPILIYIADNKHDHNNNNQPLHSSTLHLRQFLQKGTLIITISCRGMLTSDLLTFYKGSGENIQSYLSDIQSTIQWVGNNLGTNISLYANGYISSLAGMMINVRYPFLLTSTVLHNGVYQLIDEKSLTNKSQVEYFMRLGDVVNQPKERQQKVIKFWQQYNIASLLFKRSKLATKKDIDEQPKPKFVEQQQYQQQQPTTKTNTSNQQPSPNTPAIKIGTLQHILISCSNTTLSKQQARRMIYHLRRNPHFRYQQVQLKEFLQGEDQELFNLAYIYGKMRERMELDSISSSRQ